LILEQALCDDLVSVSLQFIDIPISHHKSASEKFSLGTGEVDGETAKQLSYNHRRAVSVAWEKKDVDLRVSLAYTSSSGRRILLFAMPG
jgi:hypothetical protein